jgi:hypothetical protein
MAVCEWRFSEEGYATCRHCGRRVATKSRTVRALCAANQGTGLVELSPPQRKQSGPGTELKRLLAGWPFYITPRPNCRCEEYAAQMDVWGPDECERRLGEIVGWLREEAASRGLPFVDAAGRLLVRRAIARARAATPPPPKSGPTG